MFFYTSPAGIYFHQGIMLESKYQSEALNVACWCDLQLSAKQSWLRFSDTGPVLSESKAEDSVSCCPGNVTKLTICHTFYIKPSTKGTSGITAKWFAFQTTQLGTVKVLLLLLTLQPRRTAEKKNKLCLFNILKLSGNWDLVHPYFCQGHHPK